MEKKLRADTQRTRDRLLDATGRLTERKGLDFTLPELAREAGVSTATVYRHFEALQELRLEFYHRSLSGLLADLEELLDKYEGFRLFDVICGQILEHFEVWGRPASILRSTRGYLERYRDGDSLVVQHYGLLERVLVNLIDRGIVPEQDHETAVLVWATIFDERVYLDFRFGKGLSAQETTRVMGATVLSFLRSPALR